MDKLEEAIDSYLEGNISKTVKLLKEYITEDNGDIGKAFYYLGLSYANENKLTFACESLQEAIKFDFSKSLYHYKLGDVYSKLMIFDKAIDELNLTLKLNPEHIRAKYQLGLIYFKKGDIENAIDTFKSITKLSPDFASAYYHLGLSYFYIANNDDAKVNFYKAIHLNPNYDEANIKLAEILYSEGAVNDALKITDIIYSNGLRTFPFLKLYAILNKKIGDSVKLKNVIEDLRLLFPHNSEIENEI